MNKRAEIICSYFKMNNKDDEFKISLGNKKFSIIKNNIKIFYYGVMEYLNNIAFMEFFMKSSMIKEKMLNTDYQINHIITKKLEKNFLFGIKYIYCDTIELNNTSYIKYECNKSVINFISYINNDIRAIKIYIKIHNRYFKRLIYKYFYNSKHIHFKYTDYKIFIPNKYELLYYSKYFHIY